MGMFIPLRADRLSVEWRAKQREAGRKARPSFQLYGHRVGGDRWPERRRESSTITVRTIWGGGGGEREERAYMGTGSIRRGRRGKG